MRLAYFCAWSYSRRPLSVWLVIVLLETAVGTALWVATYAVIWRNRLATEDSGLGTQDSGLRTGTRD